MHYGGPCDSHINYPGEAKGGYLYVPTTDRVILWRGMEGLNVLEQVTLAKTIAEKVGAMDAFLMRQHKKVKERPVSIDRALRMISYCKGGVKIRKLCSHLDINIKTLERQFKSALGLTPKEFSSIIRINHAYRLMNQDQKRQVGDIVFECGYYYQAHFRIEFPALHMLHS